MNLKFIRCFIPRYRANSLSLLLLTLLGCWSARVEAQKLDWAIHFGADSSFVNVRAIQADNAGNVYVSGFFDGDVDFDPGVGTAILSGPSGYAENTFLAKYDATGKYIWGRAFASAGWSGTSDARLEVDREGSVYTAFGSAGVSFQNGSRIDTLKGEGIFMFKYDKSGSYQWGKVLDNVPNCYGGIRVDGSGNIYLAGSQRGLNDTADFDPGPAKVSFSASVLSALSKGNEIGYLAKYTNNGDFIWVKEAANVIDDTTTGSDRRSFNMVLDNSGNVFLTGFYTSATDFAPGADTVILRFAMGTNDFLAKYDSSGKCLWAKATGSWTNTGGSLMQADSFGNIYVTGLFFNPRDFDTGPDTVMLSPKGGPDVFLAKYDRDGNYLWAKQAGGIGAVTIPQGLVMSRAGNVYIAGYFLGSVAFDPCPNTPEMMAGLMDMFIARYDASGNFLSVGRMGGTMAVGNGEAVGMDIDGNIYVSGNFAGTVEFEMPGAEEKKMTSYADMSLGADGFICKLLFNDTLSRPGYTYLDVALCGKDSFVLNGTVYREAGEYTQIFPLSGACGDSTVMLSLVFGEIEKPFITINTFTLGVNNTYRTYQWLKNGQPISGATGATYTVDENANYQVVVSNGIGCIDTSDVYIVDNYTSIDALSGKGRNIRIYPNPAKDRLYIQTAEPVDVTVTDLSGRIVKHEQRTDKVGVKDMAAGVYLLQINDIAGNLLRTVKFVKE